MINCRQGGECHSNERVVGHKCLFALISRSTGARCAAAGEQSRPAGVQDTEDRRRWRRHICGLACGVPPGVHSEPPIEVGRLQKGPIWESGGCDRSYGRWVCSVRAESPRADRWPVDVTLARPSWGPCAASRAGCMRKPCTRPHRVPGRGRAAQNKGRRRRPGLPSAARGPAHGGETGPEGGGGGGGAGWTHV